MLSTCLPSSPPPRYSLENRPSILFDPVSPAIPRGGVHFSSGTPTPKVGGLPDFKMSVVRADSDSDEGEFPTTRLSSIQLKRAPVLTICGIKIQCSLEHFIPLGRMVDAGMLVRDRMDTVNLVFRDEQERKKAFRILESPKAQNFLDGYSQYQTCYVAWRPQADIAFFDLEPLDQPVFDERRRIYLKEEFKPPGYEYGPTGSIELPPPTQLEHDATLMEITSISAFFANCQPPRTPLVCPACRRLYTYIPG
ncbi:hypothetical protein JCM5350_003078 [Sporobolomyces pararoseus]